MLNAKVHADEAKIVAMAGHKGAVTVATNMAGRGTDIMLGGSVEFLADDELRKQGLEPTGETAEEYEAAWPGTVERIKAQVAAEHDEVKAAGGLYVVGTERHESRRIDNQLRGRSGRQGDPGESRFYLSLEDELMRLFKSDWVDRILQVLKIPDDVPIENKRVTGAIANAQGQIEAQNFDSRKNVLKYDDVMDRQRHVIYAERRKVLEGADLEEQIATFIDDVVEGFVTGATEGFAEEWDLDALQAQLRAAVAAVARPQRDGRRGRRRRGARPRRGDRGARRRTPTRRTQRREEEVGSEVMRELERRVVLSVLDRKWREHLYEMDYLREGIGLRGYAQRDPLVEYQREGFDMFMAIMDGIKEESVGFLFNLEVQLVDDEAGAGVRRGAGRGAAAPRAALAGPARPGRATTTGRRSRAKGLDQAEDAAAACRTPRRPRTTRRWRCRPPSGATAQPQRPGRPDGDQRRRRVRRRWVATRCAPAGRARSTSAATARPAARRA